MALTREQYNRIMRVFSERQAEDASLFRARNEEAALRIPELSMIRKELFSLNAKELEARLQKDTKKTGALRKEREDLIRTKKELLLQHGFPEDYLEMPCFCSLCRDKGFVDGKKCGCFKQLETELVNEQSGLPDFLEAVPFEEITTELYNHKAPMPDLPKTAGSMTQAQYMEKQIFPRVRMYLAGFEEPGSHNIFMTGPAGTGKTYLSACIAKSLMNSLHTVIYLSAGELFSLFGRFEFGRGDEDEMESRITLIGGCDLLIIDDLGTENLSEMNISTLFSVISRRLSAEKSTIISSNMNLKEINAAYGTRIASRIHGDYLVLPFFGTDMRLAKRAALGS